MNHTQLNWITNFIWGIADDRLCDESRRRFRRACLQEKETPLADVVDHAAEKLGAAPYRDFNIVLGAIEEEGVLQGQKLLAKRRKLLQNTLAERDEQAEPVIRKLSKLKKDADSEQVALHGIFHRTLNGASVAVEYEADTELRDTEQIPFLEDGGIEGFFRREVLPHVPDAWIDDDSMKIGYEISFTRYFYKPQLLELRQRIVDAVDQKTQTIPVIAATFGVSERYVYKLLEIREQRKDIAPVGHRGGARPKLNEKQLHKLADFVAKTPDATLEELRDLVHKRLRVRVSINTIWRMLSKLNLTVKKKTCRAGEADPKERALFQNTQRELPAKQLWLIDEYGVHLAMSRRYARSRRGERAVVTEPFQTGGNISVISAITLKGVRCPMMINGAIDGATLHSYVKQVLLPKLRKGRIVIWDNVPTHKNGDVVAAIEKKGARVIRLPAYSPDLNPKEECISKIKSILRKSKARTEIALERALKKAYSLVTPQDAKGWFCHCGYSVL